MALTSIKCPICGAKIPGAVSAQDFICPFCKFERRGDVGKKCSDLSQKAPNELFSEAPDMALPCIEDLNGYFHKKFQQLKPGELWELSTPVTRFYHKPAPLPGQINFFRAKNIMFLLEQHGFKMTWRKCRFSPVLRIVAKKC